MLTQLDAFVSISLNLETMLAPFYRAFEYVSFSNHGAHLVGGKKEANSFLFALFGAIKCSNPY